VEGWRKLVSSLRLGLWGFLDEDREGGGVFGDGVGVAICWSLKEEDDVGLDDEDVGLDLEVDGRGDFGCCDWEGKRWGCC